MKGLYVSLKTVYSPVAKNDPPAPQERFSLLQKKSGLFRKAAINILCASLLLNFSAQSQTTSFSLDTISIGSTDLSAPGRGAYQWNGYNNVYIPIINSLVNPLDAYQRFSWNEFEDGTQGSYNWNDFDVQINAAIASGRKFSFGIMSACPTCYNETISGAGITYPSWLHYQMQTESVPDWITPISSTWVPNWNSQSYLAAWNALNVALNNHINSTSYNGVQYKNAINFIDIRGFGSWGEWDLSFISNSPSDYSSGAKATAASLESIAGSVINSYSNFQTVMLGSSLDGNQLPNTQVPPEVGYYLLTTSNSAGKVGLRRDNWGALDSYIDDNFGINNPTVYNGLNFGTAVRNIYTYAPVTGEPIEVASTTNGCDYGDLNNQIVKYHASSFGNGNFAEYTQSCMQGNVITASRSSGYRLEVKSGTISSTLAAGSAFALTLNWSNIGIAPTYENWNVQFELRNGSTVLQSWTSSFNPRLFLPGTKSVTDNLTLSSSIASGTYNLYLIVRDPNGYRKPLPLANTNVLADGSYLLKNVTVGGNTGPTANAGTAQTITLPTNSISLTGVVTDVLSAISSNAWTQVSGPSTATINSASSLNATASNLIAGAYVFQLKVIDLLGLSATATVTITVNPAPTPPVANAGSNQTITLPTNTTTLTGSATDADGTITSYAWAQVSGPSTATIKSPTALVTSISKLVAGTYVFELIVKDSQNLSDTSTVTVVVNAAANQPPVANAGASQTISLPTNSVTLDGSSSNDPDGTIVAYSWTQISGPATGTIVSATGTTTLVNNLVQGTYVYKLTVTDNGGATGWDTVSVNVNAVANQPPVANAGTSKTITLPTNSLTLDGSKSYDPDGTIASFAWSQVSGPSAATITNGSTSAPTVAGLVAGTYVFQLAVTDNGGATTTAQVKIIVNAAANQPPVANAGASQSITLPTNSATLDGSASQDPNGSITTYSWTKISGPAQGSIGNTANVTTTVTNLVQGTYVYKLTVTDNNGATASDTVSVTVNAAANQPPVADAGTSKTVKLPTNSVTLDGSKSYDPDGTIASFAWSQVSGPSTATITNSNTSAPIVSGLVAGTYMFLLTVTDNSGATATAQVKIVVNVAANQPPVANAGASQSITLPTNSATLDGSASQDPDGSITTYSWIKISGPTQGSIANTANATTTVTNLVQGTYVYKLTVTDNNGATASDTVSVTVNAAANQSPIANAGASKTITLPTSTVSLDATKSYDPDGTIASYSWSQISGPSTATITGGNTTTPTISNLQAGSYYFDVTVTDNNGATNDAQVKVTVNTAANINPIANAGANQTIILPADSVIVDGSASQDPNGTLTTYAWSQVSGPGTANIVNPASVTTTIGSLIPGTYVFQLTVTDNNGNSASDQITITVAAAVNQLPVANAGTSKTITLPTSTVSLDATKSYDPDGTIASYSWSQTSGPSTATITGGNTATPSISNLQAGSYYFDVTVTDNSGATNDAQVKVTVNAAANINPVANAGADQTIILPADSVIVDGSASQDPNGTLTTYAWSQVSGPGTANIVSPASVTTTIGSLIPGTYVFQLTVTDNNGNSASDQITITVAAAVNQLPVANAGTSKTITLPTSTVSLDATKSYDPDGTIASYSWIQTSGPSTATITGGNTATPSISNLQAGSYYFQVTVTDNNGATSKASVKVIVTAAIVNLPPVANAGSNETIVLPVDSVTLDGSGSEDPDGSIAKYSWSKISGPTQGSIANASSVTTLANNLTQGSYIYKLTVTDNGGVSSSDTVIITVNAAANKPPIANTGASKTLTLPTNSTTLDGSKSYDPDGTIAAYKWTEVSGPTAATMTNSTTSTPTVSALKAGSYIFQLTVTDNSGANGNAQVKIVVNTPPNQAPVANAGTDQSITLPTNSVTLDGSKSADPDGTIVSYSWNKISGTGAITITNSNTAKPTVVGLLAGTYIFQLTVTDNAGASSTDNVTVVVNPAPTSNQPPVANAGGNQTLTLPTNSTTLNGSKSADPDGTISTYAWTKVSGGAGTIANAASAKATISGLQAGKYVYSLKVTDNKGATGSTQVTITVSPATANIPPIANAGADQSVTLPTSSVTLDGSKSTDPDGAIVSYTWTKVSGTGGTLTNATAVKATASGLQAGTYVYELTVKDNIGATSSDEVTITVNAAGTAVLLAPVANAGSDTTLAIPVTSTMLNGTASSGSIDSYQWSQVAGPDTATINSPNSATSLVSNLTVGEYQFQLKVVNTKGGSSTATVKVTVIDNLRSTESLLLYPNPAQSTINLRLVSDSTGSMKVNIFDLRGTLVRTFETTKSSSFFDQGFNISSLAHGMYVMQIVIGTNKVMTSKFLKQ